MAFNIAVKSKYNPFTYEDYIKPLEQYTKNYKEQENKLQEALIDIASLEPFINDDQINNDQNNAEYIKQYKDYVKSLEDLTNSLYTEGFNRSTQSQGFLNARKAYKSQITPLTEALSAMKKAHAEETKLESQGYILGKGARNYSISDYYGLNTPEETKRVSLDSIESNTAAIAKNITSNMKTRYSISENQILQGLRGYTAQKGINPLDYMQNIEGLSVADRNVIGLIKTQVQERILNDLGYTPEEYEALDQYTKNRINERIQTGFIKGLSYGENITPRAAGAGNGNGGGGSKYNYPIISVVAQNTKPEERYSEWTKGINNEINTRVGELQKKNAKNIIVTFGGKTPSKNTQTGKYDISNISTMEVIKDHTLLIIQYTDDKGNTKYEQVGIKGGRLSNTHGTATKGSSAFGRVAAEEDDE